MPDPNHPQFGYLRWPVDEPERSWEPLPCQSIRIQHTSNWPSFMLRSVTFFRDGRAIAANSYEDLASARDPAYEGRFEQSLSHEVYGLLCYMIERADFWHLQPDYTVQISDCSWNVITVEGERETRSVRDHCLRAPVDLIAFEFAFERVDRTLNWKRIADAAKPEE